VTDGQGRAKFPSTALRIPLILLAVTPLRPRALLLRSTRHRARVPSEIGASRSGGLTATARSPGPSRYTSIEPGSSFAIVPRGSVRSLEGGQDHARSRRRSAAHRADQDRRDASMTGRRECAPHPESRIPRRSDSHRGGPLTRDMASSIRFDRGERLGPGDRTVAVTRRFGELRFQDDSSAMGVLSE